MKLKMEPSSVIKARLGIQSGGKVHAFFTATCERYMSPFVPKKDGNLVDNTTKTVDTITYESPYAHYMWYGKVMGPNIPIKKDKQGNVLEWVSPKGKPKHYTGKDIKYTNEPLEGAHWDQRMWTSKGREVVKEVQAYLDRGCK